MFSIIMNPEGVPEVSFVKDGRIYSKAVSDEDLFSHLKNGMTFNTGMLPPGTRYFWNKGNEYVLVVEVPAHRRTLLVKHDYSTVVHTIDDVPLPCSVFVFKIKNTPQSGSNKFFITDMQLHAVKEAGIQGMETVLYEYPTPNVEWSRICWGRDRKVIDNLKYLSGIEGAVRAFFRTHFNDHIWHHDSLNKDCPLKKRFSWAKIEDYFKVLAEQDKFEDSWLAPAYNSCFKTLKSAIEIYTD